MSVWWTKEDEERVEKVLFTLRERNVIEVRRSLKPGFPPDSGFMKLRSDRREAAKDLTLQEFEWIPMFPKAKDINYFVRGKVCCSSSLIFFS